jgi:hypothetical protein
MLAGNVNISVVELTGIVYKCTAFSSFHQSPSPPEYGRTDQHHAVCLHALVDPCQPAERQHPRVSLLHQPLLDFLASRVSFLLQQ